MKATIPEEKVSISDLIEHHLEFERERGIEWKNNKLYIRLLESISLLIEEIGEFSSIVNRIERKGHEMNFQDYRNITEEFTDIFIYMIKIASYLGIDLETEYFRKMKVVKKKADENNLKYVYSHTVSGEKLS